MPLISDSSLKRTLSAMGLILCCCALVLINGRFGAPIWIDEFLHFALGSHDSLQEAWGTISKTTTGIHALNHGQTGTYLLLDYVLLQEFGASLFALRLPSLISTFWLLLCSLLILRVLGLKLTWKYLLVLMLFSQTVLMRYVGEARPYMPLAAASVGCLAYYLMPLSVRKSWWARMVGGGSIALGVLMHPYFCVYWSSLWLYAYWHAVFAGNLTLGLKSLLRHMNVPLTVFGAALFMAVGALTWMRGDPMLLFDPFQWLGRATLPGIFINDALFQFITPLGSVLLVCCALVLICYTVLKDSPRVRLRPLISPIVLIFLMVFVALGLSFVSYLNDYWILQRQWIASIAIVPVATVWLLFEITRQIPKRYLGSPQLIFVVVLAVFGVRGYFLSVEKLKNLSVFLRTERAVAAVHEGAFKGPIPTTHQGWVALAQQNIDAGGPVWPVFRHFYEAEMREGNDHAR